MIRLGFATLALLAGASHVIATELPALPNSVADAMAQASPQAMAEYRRKLREYEEARAPIDAYWNLISEKRRGRNAKRRAGQQITLDDYVLTQPPVYTGPKRPVNPEPEEAKPPRERKAIPVAADLVQAAAEHFRRAVSVAPQGTPLSRAVLWHLGSALEATGKNDQALLYYIKYYVSGKPDPVRRAVIENVYKKVNGTLDGLDDKIGPGFSAPSPTPTPNSSSNPALFGR